MNEDDLIPKERGREGGFESIPGWFNHGLTRLLMYGN